MNRKGLKGRARPDDAADTLDACDSCHRFIHDNPKISYAQGWLRKSGPIRHD